MYTNDLGAKVGISCVDCYYRGQKIDSKPQSAFLRILECLRLNDLISERCFNHVQWNKREFNTRRGKGLNLKFRYHIESGHRHFFAGIQLRKLAAWGSRKTARWWPWREKGGFWREIDLGLGFVVWMVFWSFIFVLPCQNLSIIMVQHLEKITRVY